MRKLIEKIENYLSSNAEPGPLQKGERIAQTIDNFGTPSIDIENDVATFRIMGTIFYTVVVSDISGALRTKCSCPYDWGGICKHQVGALLYLKDYLQKNQNLSSRVRLTRTAPVRKLKQRRSGENYLLQDYHNMSYNWLNGLINFYEMKRAHSFSLSDLVVTNELVRCVVEENKRNYWQPNKQQIVQFRETADGLQTSCSCDQLVEKLCVHQVAALSEIIHRYGEDFFIVLDPDYMNSARNSMSKRSGIPLDQLDDYFRFDFKHRKFVPREKASGLLSFNEDNQQLARKLIGNLVAEEKFTLPSWSKDSDKAQRMGYVFTFHEPTAFRLTPITGTPQDEFWMKYIEEYDNRRPPAQLDAEDEAILSALAELKIFQDRYDKNYAPSDDEKLNAQKFYHKTLQKIFPLLQQRAYLYLRFDGQAQNKIKKSQLTPIQLSPDVVSLFFELVEEDIFYSLQAKLKIGEQIVDLADPQLDVRSLLPFYSLVYWKENLYLHPTLQQAETLFRLVRQNRVFKVIKKDFRPFFEQIVTPLSAHFPIDTSGMKELKQLTVQLSPQSKNIYLSELGNFILFKPVVSYDHDQSVNPKLDNKLIVHQDNTIVTFEREATYEQQFLETMEAIHPAFAEQRYQEFFFLPFTELSRNGWFFKIFDSFNEAGIEVFGINDLKTIQYSPFKANVNTHIKSGLDWFDVSIELSFGEENVKLNDVRKAIMRNERFVKLSNGKLGILPEEWFDKLSKFFRVGEIEKGQLKISKLKFTIVDELFEQIDDAEVMEELLEKKRRLTNFQNIKEVSLPANITATLRDYQVAGFHWLNFLNEFKWGGILADDMGLGKTLQILTFLQDQCNKSGLPNLVVVPTTLLFNWENEIKKFAPELEYLIHHGSDRTSRHSKFRDYNIIITTYGLVVNDAELFSRIHFNYVVLDESQAIKNPSSKRYRAACLLKSNNKLAMTGTPIENNTFDLFAQMNFLNPGFLGSQQSFKNEFSRPIDSEGDAERAAELQKLIKPFVLRRTKEQVASELPPKVEDYIYCTMEEPQRKVYEAYRNKYRDFLMQKIEEDGLQRSKLFVLEGLLKLRQICDSPEILSDEEDYGTNSIKIKELLSHITEKTGKHKILVFSQFVRMLRVIERELANNDITYEYLDGQSSQKARQASVENFQTNEDCRVFLISIKAGGTGLNLTAADYVYIVDPWWNPAVENQAIDRTHRIGQDKHIIAYRMICKDTIEEKIMKLQAKKLRIASDIIHTDEAFMKNLEQGDIMELFS